MLNPKTMANAKIGTMGIRCRSVRQEPKEFATVAFLKNEN